MAFSKFTILPPSTYLNTDGDWVDKDNILTEGIYKSQPSQPSVAFSAETETKPSISPVQIAKDVGQGIARSGAAVALTLAGEPVLPTYPEGTIESKISKTLFGEDEVKSLATRIAEGEIKAKELGLGKASLPGSFALIGGLTALDFTPFGGEKNLAKTLLKETDETIIRTILKKVGIADDLIPSYSESFAKATKIEEINKGLKSLKEIQETTKKVSGVEKGLKLAPEGKQVAKTGFQFRERGFVTSVKEELPDITKVAGQYVPRNTDRLAIKARTLIKEDLKSAEKMAITGTDDDAVAVGAELLKFYNNEAVKATNETVKDALYDKAAELANLMARNLTEQGRAVQAASILGRMTPEGQIRFAARQIQKYNEEVEKAGKGIIGLKKKIPELTAEQEKTIVQEMKEIEAMADGTEKAMKFQQLQNYISDLVPSSLYQKIVSVWKAGLLTGIKTSGLNIFSNLTHAATETIKDIPALVVDRVASLFTGKRTIGLTLKTGGGIKEGFEKGWRYVKTGFDERNIGAKLDYKRVNFGKGKIAKGLQKYEETVFHIIGAEDQPFYYGAKARSLRDQAIAQAQNAKLKEEEAQKFINNLIENPTDEMVKYAVLDAETSVFQNQTTLGKIAKAIQRAPGGEIVVPFGRTPSAVATQVINYSPLGFAKPVTRIIKAIKTGEFDQRLFAQEAGRAITGTAILAGGYELYKTGRISLDRPTTEKEQKLWELEGRQANSIKVGDKWRTAQTLGPAGMLLLIGAHFRNALDETGSATEAMTKAFFGGIKSFTEQTFLRGMSQTIEAITDPERSAEGYLGSQLASTIPTLISDIARATDTKERRTENPIWQRAKMRIPFLRETLEPQIDVLGRERETVGNPLEIMADPTRPSKDISTPLVKELRRLWDAGYKASPTLLGDKKGFEALTPEQNTELWKRAGEILDKKLNNLINHEAYKKLPDDLKSKKVEEFVDKSKLYARVEKVLELTQELKGEELKKELSRLKAGGLMTREVFTEFLRLR